MEGRLHTQATQVIDPRFLRESQDKMMKGRANAVRWSALVLDMLKHLPQAKEELIQTKQGLSQLLMPRRDKFTKQER